MPSACSKPLAAQVGRVDQHGVDYERPARIVVADLEADVARRLQHVAGRDRLPDAVDLLVDERPALAQLPADRPAPRQVLRQRDGDRVRSGEPRGQRARDQPCQAEQRAQKDAAREPMGAASPVYVHHPWHLPPAQAPRGPAHTGEVGPSPAPGGRAPGGGPPRINGGQRPPLQGFRSGPSRDAEDAHAALRTRGRGVRAQSSSTVALGGPAGPHPLPPLPRGERG